MKQSSLLSLKVWSAPAELRCPSQSSLKCGCGRFDNVPRLTPPGVGWRLPPVYGRFPAPDLRFGDAEYNEALPRGSRAKGPLNFADRPALDRRYKSPSNQPVLHKDTVNLGVVRAGDADIGSEVKRPHLDSESRRAARHPLKLSKLRPRI